MQYPRASEGSFNRRGAVRGTAHLARASRCHNARNHLEDSAAIIATPPREPRARLDLHASYARGSGRHRACVAHAQRTLIFRKPHANIAGYYKIPIFEFIVALCEPMIDAVKASYFPYRLVYSLSTRHYKRTRTYVYRRVSRFSLLFLKTARMFTRLYVDDFFPWSLRRSAAAATAAVKLLGNYKMANRGGKNQSSMQLATMSYISTRTSASARGALQSIWMVAQYFPIKAANSSYCGRSDPVPLLQRQSSFFIAQHSHARIHVSVLAPLRLFECAVYIRIRNRARERFAAARRVIRTLRTTCITSTRTHACIKSGSYKLFYLTRSPRAATAADTQLAHHFMNLV
uniref:Uncharacterized protein n=1 Tax=Trichogramma kaykai TaxID=54128 RepID=A0ABD2W9A9_9HYME